MIWKRKNFCINVKNSKGEHVKIHLKVEEKNRTLLGLALSDSTVVMEFWDK